MARDANGNYTLPSTVTPVVSGTTILSNYANTVDDDMETEFTDSLSRSGKGGMLAPFKAADGTVSLPGIAFSLDTNTGFYRIGDDEFGVSIGGVNKATFNTSGLTLAAPLPLASGGTGSSTLTAGEVAQIENIDNVTISNAQWDYLGGLDQALTTASNVTFNNGTFSGNISFGSSTVRLESVSTANVVGLFPIVGGVPDGARAFRYSNPLGGWEFLTQLVVQGALTVTGNIVPSPDNAVSCGTAPNRFTEVFAVNGSINTSDENQKTPFTPLSELEKQAYRAVKDLIGNFKWLHAIEAKGEESARLHVGVPAQSAIAAFDAIMGEGEAFKRGWACLDDVPIYEDPAAEDPVQVGTEQRYSIRYSELTLAMVASLL